MKTYTYLDLRLMAKMKQPPQKNLQAKTLSDYIYITISLY